MLTFLVFICLALACQVQCQPCLQMSNEQPGVASNLGRCIFSQPTCLQSQVTGADGCSQTVISQLNQNSPCATLFQPLSQPAQSVQLINQPPQINNPLDNPVIVDNSIANSLADTIQLLIVSNLIEETINNFNSQNPNVNTETAKASIGNAVTKYLVEKNNPCDVCINSRPVQTVTQVPVATDNNCDFGYRVVSTVAPTCASNKCYCAPKCSSSKTNECNQNCGCTYTCSCSPSTSNCGCTSNCGYSSVYDCTPYSTSSSVCESSPKCVCSINCGCTPTSYSCPKCVSSKLSDCSTVSNYVYDCRTPKYYSSNNINCNSNCGSSKNCDCACNNCGYNTINRCTCGCGCDNNCYTSSSCNNNDCISDCGCNGCCSNPCCDEVIEIDLSDLVLYAEVPVPQYSCYPSPFYPQYSPFSTEIVMPTAIPAQITCNIDCVKRCKPTYSVSCC